MIGWHLRRVLKAKYMRMTGQPEARIFQTLRIGGPGQGAFHRLLERRGIVQICQDFRQLIRADLAMKTGQDAQIALQRLVVALCQ